MSLLRAAVAAEVRRRDRELVALIAHQLEPYRVTVLVTDDCRIALRLGASTYLEVPVDETARRRLDDVELAHLVAREARRRWRQLEPEPLPDNIERGRE